MKNPWIQLGLVLLSLPLPALVQAEAPALPNPASEFKPYWSFQIGLASSGTPGDKGGGQNANDLTFTATRDFSESGDYVSMEAMGGRQKVEDSIAKYGSLSVNGGLGLGFFSPSLSLSAQTGDSGLFATTAGLNLGFQIWDDINVGVNVTGGLSSHQIPLSAIIPITGVPDTLFEIDGKSLGAGLSLSWATSEIFILTLSGQTSNEITYQIQNLTHSKKLALNQSSVIPSTSLGFNWAFLKDFSLSGSVQRSEEFEPAGISYSPSLGQTVDNTEDTTLYFSGYSVGLTYSFQ